MVRKLGIVVAVLCCAALFALNVHAQSTVPSSNAPAVQSANVQESGEIAQLRQQLEALQKQAEPIREQLKKIEDQAKPLREQLKPIREQMETIHKKIRELRGERREERQQHRTQMKLQAPSTAASQQK